MKALYSAATGMAAQQTTIDTIANNLANVNTAGFKRSTASFQDLFYQELATSGEDGATPNTAQMGAGVRMISVDKQHTQGFTKITDRSLDVAINGRGFFVLSANDGRELYTRDGHFSRDADGYVVSSGGVQLSGGINIPDDATQIVIEDDGSVMYATDADAEMVTAGVLEIAAFSNPGGLRALGGNVFVATGKSGDPQILDAKVTSKQLEGSNVDPATELIALIQAQRAYELISKVIQAADETLQTAANLRR
jgi:flagellar basal-body rod protein FlgG